MPIYPGREEPLLPGLAWQPKAPQASALVRWAHDEFFPQGQVVEFLRQTIRAHPGEVILLSIGPLTNVASLFAADAEIPSLLKGLVMMCGVFTNRMAGIGPLEWNAMLDPVATAIVYRAAARVHRSIGLDVTTQVTMPAAEVRQRFQVPLLRPVLDFAEVWFQHVDRITFHDPLAATTIFDDGICTFERGRVDVELKSDRLLGDDPLVRGCQRYRNSLWSARSGSGGEPAAVLRALFLRIFEMTHTLPPPPWGAIPSPRQLAWHRLETYGFIHFTTNTFTDLEWGYGDENPQVFNPTALDTRQWARVAKEGGLKGLILTCKHHDGFCLWPSQYTAHSVVNSPWQNGQGDVVRELADACREFGLKMGIYLSPWDRNHSLYGQPAYVEYYRDQLVELLTLYGPIFEVWHDGANGGDGWYGGACETRKIDPASYYGWLETWGLVRLLQPEAVIFCDAGGDIRWVGNEAGIGSETTWCTFNPAGSISRLS